MLRSSPFGAIGLAAVLLSTASVASATGQHDDGDQCDAAEIDLGTATDYNLFVLGSFTGTNSDVQGRAAIGDHAGLTNYSVGTTASGGAVLSVGDDLTASGGQVYNGDAEAGGNCYTTSFNVLSGTLSCNDAGAFDAGDHATEMYGLSATFGGYATNGATITHPWGGVTLEGTDHGLNVFTLNLDNLGFNAGVSNISSYEVEAPAGSLVVVNVLGDTAPLFKNAGFTLSGVSAHDIVWNLEDQTALTIHGISVQGSILAPKADVQFDNGNIEGTLVAASAAGGGQFHDFRFGGEVDCPPPPPPPPPPPECPTAGDLGVATDYNLFILGSFTGSGSDVQGRAAIGEDADITNYSVGSALTPPGVSLSVGDDLTALSAQIYGGDVEVGGDCDLVSFNTLDGGTSCNDASAFDASDHAGSMMGVSAFLSGLTVNGTTTTQSWGGVSFLGSSSDLNVFEIDLDSVSFDPWVSNIVGYTITAPAGSTVVINWKGSTSRLFQNAGFTLSGVSGHDIIHNLETQTSLTISGISVQGTILAPKATVDFNGGNIDGTLIAAEAMGTGQYHHVEFTGDICPPEGDGGYDDGHDGEDCDDGSHHHGKK